MLLLVFLVETTPDALWHALTNHHDTVDSNTAATAVSTKHIHCEALQSSLPSFSKSETTDVSASIFFVASFYATILVPAGYVHDVASTGRAPPIIG